VHLIQCFCSRKACPSNCRLFNITYTQWAPAGHITSSFFRPLSFAMCECRTETLCSCC